MLYAIREFSNRRVKALEVGLHLLVSYLGYSGGDTYEDVFAEVFSLA
jgi:hypothetical protein